MIVAKQNFRDEELAEPRTVLRDAGAKVTIAASSTRESVGMLGRVKVRPEITLDQVDPTAYDAIVFVGGQGASEYWNDKTAHRIATEAYAAGKIVAAICIAPVTLANAGLLKGRKATVFPSEKDALVKGGANYTGAGVEVDGRIITADGPASATKFGKVVRDALERQ
jgi:protease I